ncbi:MAG: branched-chain amino acid ABC transporter permease, partial [Acidocella sp. 20-61-6]
MKDPIAAVKDAAAVAFVALLLFGPFLGLKLGDNNAGNLTLSTRPELLFLAVAGVFVARLLLLFYHEHRGKRPPAARMSQAVTGAGKYLAPALLIFAIAMPLLPGIANSYIDLGVLIMTYVMLGWGLNIVVGLAGLLDLGYVAFYAVGAYSFALLNHKFGFGFWECLPLCGILAAAWGIFLGFPVLRLRGDYLAIVTLA